MKYFVTVYSGITGDLTDEDVAEGLSPMDAIREFGAERGWKPSRDSLDDDTAPYGYWTLTETDGSRIFVTEMKGICDEPDH